MFPCRQGAGVEGSRGWSPHGGGVQGARQQQLGVLGNPRQLRFSWDKEPADSVNSVNCLASTLDAFFFYFFFFFGWMSILSHGFLRSATPAMQIPHHAWVLLPNSRPVRCIGSALTWTGQGGVLPSLIFFFFLFPWSMGFLLVTSSYPMCCG